MKLSLKLMIAVTLCALDLSVGWAQRQYPGSPGLPEDFQTEHLGRTLFSSV